MGVTFSQMIPPSPTLTEANLPSQKGKVFIVTGGYSGVGLELSILLYQAGAKVYIGGRSETKAKEAIAHITRQSTKTPGELAFLQFSLDDLSTIKPAVEEFKAAESRLDVLFNNAGVSNPPAGSVTAQGHELTMGTNCLGPHLLTELLLPVLQSTSKDSPSGVVRVVWTSSIVVDLAAPKEGIKMDKIINPRNEQQLSYLNSKTGNWFLADALASRVGAGRDGILSLTQNPGNLMTPLLRHVPIVRFLARPILYESKMGAYTELWAGLSDELRIEDGGVYIIPWGRKHSAPRRDLLAAMKSQEDGGSGVGAEFVQWCDHQIADYR